MSGLMQVPWQLSVEGLRKQIDFCLEHVLHLISNAKNLINVDNVSLYTNEAENTVALIPLCSYVY